MALEICSITKRINNGMFMLKAENALVRMKTPKISLSVIQPPPQNDTTGKYQVAKFYADQTEIYRMIHHFFYGNGASPELLKSYKGGMDKKLGVIVARIFSVVITKNNSGATYYKFTIENVEGEQSYTTNKYNQQVPGVVKPKRGGTVFSRCSISISHEEMFYFIECLKMEFQAWRNALNVDYYYHPEHFYQNNQQQNDYINQHI